MNKLDERSERPLGSRCKAVHSSMTPYKMDPARKEMPGKSGTRSTLGDLVATRGAWRIFGRNNDHHGIHGLVFRYDNLLCRSNIAMTN